ncbi:MAG: hypothetical protein AAF631_06320, partial [Pseudomonadota bacterium]
GSREADDFIFGGAGDDTITGGGGAQDWEDRLTGGRGDDVILATGIEVSQDGTAIMTGGTGADIFVPAFGYGNTVPDTRVTDFRAGRDTLAVDFTAGYFTTVPGEVAPVDAADRGLRVERDDAAALRFTVELVNRFGDLETHEFNYLRGNGAFRHYQDSDGWRVMARLDGAPDLGIEDFAFYDWA